MLTLSTIYPKGRNAIFSSAIDIRKLILVSVKDISITNLIYIYTNNINKLRFTINKLLINIIN